MKIGRKLVLIISAVNVICIGVLTFASLTFAKNQISTMAYENVRAVAENSGNRINMWLGNYLGEVRALGQIMSHYDDFRAEDRRPMFNSMLHTLVEENQGLVAAWAVFEPNALDGMDAEFVNTRGSDATGRFLTVYTRENGRITLSAVTGYDSTGIDGAYYFTSFRSGNDAIIEPYHFLRNGQTKLITSLTVPLKSYGKVIGVAGVDIELAEIQALAAEIKPFGVGDAAVFSNGGIIVAHPDPGRFGRNMRETERDTAGLYLNEMIQAVRSGTEFRCENYWPQFNSDMLIALSPINVGSIGTPWSFAASAPVRTIMAPVYQMTSVLILLGMIMLGILTVIIFLVARSIVAPLKSMEAGFAAICEGDLTHDLEVNSNDEIGNISRSFNISTGKVRSLIATIKSQAAALFEVGNALAVDMNETAAAINEITANTQSIKTRVLSQSASVTETNAAMEQISANINKLSNHIDNQSVSVARSSSAVEQMLANIQSVTDTLIKNADKVQNLTAASKVGREGLEEVAADIQKIALESQGLLEINKVMKNISSQTNLLSMNAAIEAAHAGEAGKGFAVVADAIRNLAINSGEQSRTINEVLKKIMEAINKITRSAGNVLEKFAAIDEGVKNVAEQEEYIRNAMEEQGVGSKQILKAIDELNDITRQVKDGSQEMLSGSKEVIQETKNLEHVTQEITGGINEMASGADQINTAVAHINEISSQNKESINILVQEVSRFKVDNAPALHAN